ncbi:MAG: excinuclease ABC subunit UvrC [Planctomycetes bacterium]|nr:excinuclease ABC subunit UvrC [Planctomycetota bacterium]
MDACHGRQALLEKIGRFPATPGVYLMKDSRSRVIYVGKAVNLRARVRSYFSSASDTRVFHRFLVEKIAAVDCIMTETETEALLLENNLIKKHRPAYNIRLRDDKNYLCLRVSIAEDWPRVQVTRRYQQDGNLYFGPYGSAGAVREMLRVIKKIFPLRTCTDAFFKSRKRPCIEHDIGRCTAPCVNLITPERYQEDVGEVVLFLKGKNRELLEILKGKMKSAAAGQKFELAARYRDQIRAIEKVFEVQKVQDAGHGDMDVFAHVRQGDRILLQEMVIRDGKLISSQSHAFESALESAEIFSSFLAQYYLAERFIPKRILCEVDFPERAILAQWLREKNSAAVEILVPRRGEKARLIEMAVENARNALQLANSRSERLEATMKSLRALLHLGQPPRRIECYDISNFQGTHAVGAMVVFEDGVPQRDDYRRFRIKTVSGADDFHMLQEVLERRLKRLRAEPESFPDLLVIDGGKGQLKIAQTALRAHGLEGVGVIGLAKQRWHKKTAERIFVPGRDEPLPLTQDSAESLLIQEIRDEAHRFAVRYHRELRRKAAFHTGLEGIYGIGEGRRDRLIQRFGTIEAIKGASEAALAEVVGPRTAGKIFSHFHPPSSPPPS